MTKEMNVHCNFLKNSLTCVLLEHMMDVLLNVRTRSGKHTFREDVYTRTLKYSRWNNENYINNSLEHSYETEKGKSPLVGVEPDASHLPDKCCRLLDYRGFPICLISLIQVI